MILPKAGMKMAPPAIVKKLTNVMTVSEMLMRNRLRQGKKSPSQSAEKTNEEEEKVNPPRALNF